LMEILPAGLTHFLYSDCGSASVEIALKLALGYWKNLGHTQRRSFLCFEGGYHGDTFGAMSVGGPSVFNSEYRDLLFPSLTVPYPEAHLGEEFEDSVLDWIADELRQYPERYAGIIVEPLVQGAAGMRMSRPSFFTKLRTLCTEFNTLLIFDEVFTGFGRTGDYFASTKIGVCPDIICLSKGLSGGALPLAATAVTDKIYDAFYSDEEMRGFYHSHSFMGNAIACAAANASYRLLRETESRFKEMEDQHWTHLRRISQNTRVSAARTCGTIAAFDLVSEDATGYVTSAAKRLAALLFERGVYLRPLGSVVYLVPPYCTTAEELAFIYSSIEECLDLL
ncbi:MAG: aminotransferase class III-fold pyridoxal phosphate-dependent enzyme, partial [Chlamydiia bacterium]|nr:aminotransferase class III-fold pyridoxal phosphate-dependent enzyme [Chlamydiia bacterium]